MTRYVWLYLLGRKQARDRIVELHGGAPEALPHQYDNPDWDDPYWIGWMLERALVLMKQFKTEALLS